LAQQLGLPTLVLYRKGVNQVPDQLVNHWAIIANKL